MQSALPKNLTVVAPPTLQRSTFDRSCGLKTTFDSGLLIPIFLDEVLPGDTLNLKATFFARLATPIFPIMDNLYLDSQFFFVPYRLLQANFKKLMGEQDSPGDTIAYTIPEMDGATYPPAGFNEQELPDYLGLPINVANAAWTFFISAMPFRAYNFIYNSWYKDQNLQNAVYFSDDDGPDDYADYELLRRGKRKDYFTGALPWPQKTFGGTVSTPRIPLGSDTSNPVVTTGTNIQLNTATLTDANFRNTGLTYARTYLEGTAGPDELVSFGSDSGLKTDLIAANLGTINDLRTAVQLQRFLERDARGGTRYPELVWNHFGVQTPDLQWRPEYLGGSSEKINFHPVEQSGESGTTPQGNLAAFATSITNTGFVKSFTEHGLIMGLASVRADLNYQQNLQRIWMREFRYDFYWPTFAHLGEQPIFNGEIWFNSFDGGNPTAVFGYQERYADYRYKQNSITGLFRSDAAASLDAWHLAQDFSSQPQLDATFIVENPPVSRVVAVPSEPEILFDSIFRLKHARCMPVLSTPGMMDHF